VQGTSRAAPGGLRKAAQIGDGHENAQFLDPVHVDHSSISISISEIVYRQLGCLSTERIGGSSSLGGD
jgi:hypothetical protein